MITARRPEERGARRYHLRGSRIQREFAHDVTLPERARIELASASYEHGLLRVCIPLGAKDESKRRPIPLRDVGGSPGGAGAVNGGVASVLDPGLPAKPEAPLARRCALCGEWLDDVAVSGPPSPATRFSYGLCDACWR
jgi:hypothetical protein